VRGVMCLDEDEVIEVNRGIGVHGEPQVRGSRRQKPRRDCWDIRECVNFRAMFWIKRLDS